MQTYAIFNSRTGSFTGAYDAESFSEAVDQHIEAVLHNIELADPDPRWKRKTRTWLRQASSYMVGNLVGYTVTAEQLEVIRADHAAGLRWLTPALEYGVEEFSEYVRPEDRQPLMGMAA